MSQDCDYECFDCRGCESPSVVAMAVGLVAFGVMLAMVLVVTPLRLLNVISNE